MEIKTTRDIERRLNELILNAKDLDRIEIRNEYTKREWVSVEELLEFINKARDEYVERGDFGAALLMGEFVKKLKGELDSQKE